MASLFLNTLPFVKTDSFLKLPKHLNAPEFSKREVCLPSLLEDNFGVSWVLLSVWFLRRPWGNTFRATQSQEGLLSAPEAER